MEWRDRNVDRRKGHFVYSLGVAGADALVQEGGWSRNTMAGLACGGHGIACSLFD